MNLLEGAKVLSDLLEKRHGAKMKVRAAGPVRAIGALPLFYWLGVEPPTVPASGAGDGSPGPDPCDN
jgi:hypothetical protein